MGLSITVPNFKFKNFTNLVVQVLFFLFLFLGPTFHGQGPGFKSSCRLGFEFIGTAIS